MSRGVYTRGADRETLLSNDDRRFTPGQIQNVKAAKVYVFGNDDIHEEDEEEYELEMSEIRSRRGQSNFARQDKNHTEPTFFQKELGEGDTLQKIALQYACPVSELKRMNNLITDQDFYALRTIKVPVKRYGYLTEIMAEEQKRVARGKANGATLYEEKEPPYDCYTDPESSQDFSDPETQMKVIRTLSIRDNMDSQSREAHQFLRKMDKDLSRMKQKRGDRNSLDEVISVLTNKTFHPLQKKETPGTFDGMSHCKILVIVITCCIVIPGIIAIVYFLKS